MYPNLLHHQKVKHKEFSHRFRNNWGMGSRKYLYRNHINKVMMTTFTAFAFEDTIENGGEAVKLGMFWAQSFKVAEKTVRESER